MIDPIDPIKYLDDQGAYLENFSIQQEAMRRTEEVCLDHAHARIFIDTLNELQAWPATETPAAFKALTDPINALWTNGGVITPNTISQQLRGGPVPYQGHTQLERFLYLLRYEYRGHFVWSAGTSLAFRGWLQNANLDPPIAPRSVMNCWELVVYAAIRTGLVPKADMAKAYNDPRRTAGGDPMIGYTVQQALGGLSTARGLGGVVQGNKSAGAVGHQVGDIIFEPADDSATNELTMHHVFVITELATDGDFQHHKVMQLWGTFAGGISEQVRIAEIYLSMVNVYRKVRLA